MDILILIISCILFAVSTMIFFILWITERYKRKQLPPVKPQPDFSDKRVIQAIMLKETVELQEGQEMISERHWSFNPNRVYIKWYDGFKEMNVLWKSDWGYLLQDIEGERDPKFYHTQDIYLGRPNKDVAIGYVQFDEEGDRLFYIIDVIRDPLETQISNDIVGGSI